MGTMENDDRTLQKRVKGVDDGDETPRKRVKSVLDDDVVDSFVRLILGGNWDESLSLLRRIDEIGEYLINSASLVILEQKYLELVGENSVLNALDTLKREIVPLVDNKEKAIDLSVLLAYRVQDSHVKASSKNSKLEDRKKSLVELFKLLDIPERRRLVDAYHRVIRDNAPCERLQVLREHKDKISCLRFSHNGKYLASSSADCVVIVWEVMLDGHVSLKHILPGHRKPVSCISWSPNDDQLLTCGAEEVVRRWDVGSGQCCHVYEKSGAGLVSCAWSPDGKYIFCGVNDKSICMWDPEKGNELECWKDSIAGNGIADLGVSCNEKFEIMVTSACEENVIKLFGWESKSEKLIEEDQAITSFSLSEDGKLLLVCLLNGELHLWKIDGFVRLLSKYKSHGRSVSRSCCGGMEHAFIASGSEDSRVHIWHRQSGELIKKLQGHSGAVNCVSWNPTNPHMLASGGDDNTIWVWGIDSGKHALLATHNH